MILIKENKIENEKYTPKAWEKWFHAVYFGRVYFWIKDLTVVPVHFQEYKTYVESSSWYDSSGNECSAGGYYKTLKNSKTPKLGKYVNLDTDFQARYKKAWSGGSVTVPNCRIYLDNQDAWWQTAAKKRSSYL